MAAVAARAAATEILAKSVAAMAATTAQALRREAHRLVAQRCDRRLVVDGHRTTGTGAATIGSEVDDGAFAAAAAAMARDALGNDAIGLGTARRYGARGV